MRYDPHDRTIHEDYYPTYATFRVEAPVYHNEQFDFWVQFQHEDVRAASRH
jgi:hypothetical protein